MSRCSFTAEVAAIEPHSQTSVTSRTSDISGGGCFVDTMSPFPPGTEMHLRLTKNSISFHAKAKVIYCQPGIGMGLSFTEIAPAQRVIINRWLSEAGCEPLGAVEGDGERSDRHSAAAAALEELLVLLAEKHLLTEDESAVILRRLKEI